MSSELISLSVLFQNRLFRIPDYQRGYAWKKEQLIDFWEDIINIPEDRYHYTGLLSLKMLNRDELRMLEEDDWLIDIGYKAYHVVDGQQRLTTFSILMYEIISLISNLPENKGKADSDIYIKYESIKDIKDQYLLRVRPPEHLIKSFIFGYEIDNPSSKYLIHRIFEEPHGGTLDHSYYTQNLLFAKKFFASHLKSLYETEGLAGVEKLYRIITLKLMF